MQQWSPQVWHHTIWTWFATMCMRWQWSRWRIHLKKWETYRDTYKNRQLRPKPKRSVKWSIVVTCTRVNILLWHCGCEKNIVVGSPLPSLWLYDFLATNGTFLTVHSSSQHQLPPFHPPRQRSLASKPPAEDEQHPAKMSPFHKPTWWHWKWPHLALGYLGSTKFKHFGAKLVWRDPVVWDTLGRFEDETSAVFETISRNISPWYLNQSTKMGWTLKTSRCIEVKNARSSNFYFCESWWDGSLIQTCLTAAKCMIQL